MLFQRTAPVSDPSSLECQRKQTDRSRQALVLFLALVLLFSLPLEILNIINDDALSMFLLMWTPGVCAIGLRFIRKEGFADVSFHLRDKRIVRAIVIAALTPLVIGLIAYGLAWGLKLTPLLPYNAADDVAEILPWLGVHPSLLLYGGFTLGVIVVEIICAAGEEIGWRGYMLPRLMQSDLPYPIILNGLIWSLWHWPLILYERTPDGLPPIGDASVFLLTITALGCVSAYLRLRTGSVWPSIILHASWNCIILEIFDPFTMGAGTSMWTGETGIFVALTTLVVACISAAMWRKAPLRENFRGDGGLMS
jgi:membrane protease YdiL (CAAX protease family)